MPVRSGSGGWLNHLQLLLVFGFPPLIMHTMYQEAHVNDWTGAPRAWATRVLVAGYVVAPLMAAGAFALVLGLWSGWRG